MITCPHCGSQNPDYYTQCPNCGTSLAGSRPQPQQTNGYVHPAYMEQPVTSIGHWFLWYLLVSFLPLIGAIVMYASVKDPSAKNFAKLMIIMYIIAIVLCLLIIALAVSAGIFASY